MAKFVLVFAISCAYLLLPHNLAAGVRAANPEYGSEVVTSAPEEMPSVSKNQQRRTLSLQSDCEGSLEPCQPDWGAGDDTGYGICKSNRVCNLNLIGGCVSANYATCKNRLDGSSGDACKAC